MRRAARLLAAAVVAVAASAAPAFEGNVNLFAGQKWFNVADWDPIDEQREIGILLAFGEQRAPIHFAIDVLVSRDEQRFEDPLLGATRVEGGTVEYGLGVRKVFRRHGTFHPHIGGGGTLATADFEADTEVLGSTDLSDTSFGFWIDGGLTWRLAKHLNLGVEVRYSRVNLDLGNIFGEIQIAGGGFHAGALIGFGW